MEDGSNAVGLFNWSNKEFMVSAPCSRLGIYGIQKVRDLWHQRNLGFFEKKIETKVLPHVVVLIRLWPE
jgi:hypothetical protein